MTTGYICLLMSGIWMSRLLKNNLMDDVFNNENESFQQETRLLANDYSVNLPTRFYYKKKWNAGWINIVNPFRAATVLGTPGSGKSYAVVNQFIKQQVEKGFSMYVYDFKIPDLSTIAYGVVLGFLLLSQQSSCKHGSALVRASVRSSVVSHGGNQPP